MLRTIKEFRDIWEERERSSLRADRDRRLQELQREREFQESGESAKLIDEEEKYIEEELAKKQAEATNNNNENAHIFPDDESKEIYTNYLRIKYLSHLFKDNETWRKNILALRETTVLKMPRLFQSIFYLLQ